MTFLAGWFNVSQKLQPYIEKYCNNATDTSDQVFNDNTNGLHISGNRLFSSDSFNNEKVSVAVVGHAYWAKDQQTSSASTSSNDIAKSIAQAYQKQGPSFIDRLAGQFCITLIDKNKGALFLFSDRLATHPIAFVSIDNAFFFGTQIEALKALSGINFTINSQQIFNYLYFHVVPTPQCIYDEIQYVPAGSFLYITKERTELKQYWKPEYKENEKDSEQALKEAFLSTLSSSMKATAENLGKVGCFLSGGTDSSTVSGKLTEITGEPVHTFSIGFDADGYDEMEFARTASKHFGTIHHEYYVTPEDVISAIPKIASVYDSPFGNSSAVPTFYCALLAKNEGIDTLLGGDGGDELFGGNERYLKQQIFSRYHSIPKPLRSLLIEPLVSVTSSKLKNFPLTLKAKSYIEQANTPMPMRLQTYNLLNRIGSSSIFENEFLHSINKDEPSLQLQQEYMKSGSVSLLNKMLALDLKYTLTDNDLPKVTRMSDLAGINVAFPLLENQLIDFANQLPSSLKIKNGKLRYFFKDTLKDFLPPEIISKSKHGFGLPFGPWLQNHDRLKQITLDSLNDLKNRHIVKRTFIDDLTNNHINEHAGYYGTMIWILMMLEQWYKQHENK